jgi:hypothetical protein
MWPRLPVAERTAATDQLMALAEQMDNPGYLFSVASPAHLTCLLEIGDLAAVDAEIGRLSGRIDQLGDRSAYLWYAPTYRAMRALLDGRYAEAESLIFAALEHGERAKMLDPRQNFAGQLAVLRHAQGRLGELVGTIESAHQQRNYSILWRAAVLHSWVDEGAESAARDELERWAQEGFPNPRDDHNALPALHWLAAAVLALKADRPAADLYQRLRPYSGYHAPVSLAACCFGSVDHALGQLAFAMGDFIAADRHFAAALAANSRL